MTALGLGIHSFHGWGGASEVIEVIPVNTKQKSIGSGGYIASREYVSEPFLFNLS